MERSIDLLSPGLTLTRLRHVVARLSTFWCAAEAGVDAWAAGAEDEAEKLGWSARRRSHLFARQALALGATTAEIGWSGAARPALPGPDTTGEVLGRLYVLEGSTLGGLVITRHLAGVVGAAEHDWACFNPYGPRTAAMWKELRARTASWVGAGGDPDVVLHEAVDTFETLRTWCAPIRQS